MVSDAASVARGIARRSPQGGFAAAGDRFLDQRLGGEAGVDIVVVHAGRQLDRAGWRPDDRIAPAGAGVLGPAQRALAGGGDAGVEGRSRAVAGRRARAGPRRPDQVPTTTAGKAAAAGADLEIDREEEVVADREAAVGVDPAPK